MCGPLAAASILALLDDDEDSNQPTTPPSTELVSHAHFHHRSCDSGPQNLSQLEFRQFSLRTRLLTTSTNVTSSATHRLHQLPSKTHKPPTWVRFTDPSRVPERSSRRLQRYEIPKSPSKPSPKRQPPHYASDITHEQQRKMHGQGHQLMKLYNRLSHRRRRRRQRVARRRESHTPAAS